MREFLEYVCIILNDDTNLNEVESHLSMNGYSFGIDKNRNLLFVLREEIDYIETILTDRNIVYFVKVY